MTGMAGVVLWLIIAIIMFALESATVQLVTIWFTVGALITIPIAAMGGSVTVQLAVFLISSISVLFIGRPIAKSALKLRREATNADRVIGKIGTVKEEINNIQQTGRIYIMGLDWLARTEYDGIVIPEEAEVKVLRIEGVKLIVEPLNSVQQYSAENIT